MSCYIFALCLESLLNNFECGRNDQFKPDTEFITGAKNDPGNDTFCIWKITNIALHQDNLEMKSK